MNIHGIFAALITAASLAAPATLALASPPDETLPPGQVYECTAHGQHVFSDKRCGPDASIRQLNPLNTMTPTVAAASPSPALRTPPQYYPQEPGYGSDSASGDQVEDYSSATEPSIVYYGGVRRGPFVTRARPPHHHARPHPTPAGHAAMPRR